MRAPQYVQMALDPAVPSPDRASDQRRMLSGLSVWLALPAVAYALLFPWLKLYGEILLIPVVGLALGAIIAGRERLLPPRYLPFLLFTLVTLAASLLMLMPTGWTLQHSNAAAFRHWFYVPALPIISGAFLVILERHYDWMKRHALALLLAALVLSRFARFLSGDTDTPETGYFLYAVTNDVALVGALFLLFLFRRRRPLLVDLAAIGAMLLISSSAQLQLFWIVVAGIRILKSPERVPIVAFLALAAFVLWAPTQIDLLREVDHNTAVRAVLWRDVWLAIVDTYGIGVGYGTEFIRNQFAEIVSWEWTIGSSRDDVFVGTHSTYYDVLLRDGLLGCALFLYWFVSTIRVSRNLPRPERALASAIGVMLMINSAVNVGASSVNFLFGTCICLAMLEFFARRSALAAAEEPTSAPPAPAGESWR